MNKELKKIDKVFFKAELRSEGPPSGALYT